MTSLFSLPVVLVNLVTQFLADQDNALLLQSCRNAVIAVRAIPRISEFTITMRSRDMYGRYRQVHVQVGPQYIYSIDSLDVNDIDGSMRRENEDREYRNALRVVSTDEIYHVIDMLARIPTSDIWRVRFSWYSFWPQLQLAHDLTVRLEKLPIFLEAHSLDASHWIPFHAVSRFPNLREAAIQIDEKNSESPKWPELSQLGYLYIANNRMRIRQSFQVFNSFPLWPSVHTIWSNIDIPKGYIALRHVETIDLATIPIELAAQIESITFPINELEHYTYCDAAEIWRKRSKDKVIVRLKHCRALRQFTFKPPQEQCLRVREPSCDTYTVVVQCNESVEITHSFASYLIRDPHC